MSATDRSDRFARLERWLSLAVAAAAVVAALGALYQTTLARRQMRAAAWPYVGQANSLTDGGAYVRTVGNQGVGPARVRYVRVAVDGRTVPTWDAAILALTGAAPKSYSYSWIGTGRVLSPGSADTLLSLSPGPQAVAFARAARQRLDVAICYCSVYDECWIAEDRRVDPRSVGACPPAGASAAFQQ